MIICVHLTWWPISPTCFSVVLFFWLGNDFSPSSKSFGFQGTQPDELTIRRLIRKGTINRVFTPMVCGTAFKNKGVQPLLDAVAE